MPALWGKPEVTECAQRIVEIFRSFGYNLPETEYIIRRTRAGYWQLSAGALSWTLERTDHEYLPTYGGWERATDLVRAWRKDTNSVEVRGYRQEDVIALETKGH